ncbi:MAG: hypothetical protein DLM59_08190 [Pseudonocardiales bacterium]|nr:MAG: hypothetical protein DLM59_08190 [Pseudonocardiales bacterium]
MPEEPDTTERDSLIVKLERLAGRGYRPPRGIRSAARVVAYDLLNAATPAVPERKVYALVDGASLLVRDGSEESARLCLEAVTTPRVAGDVVRVLTDDQGTG